MEFVAAVVTVAAIVAVVAVATVQAVASVVDVQTTLKPNLPKNLQPVFNTNLLQLFKSGGDNNTESSVYYT